MEICNREKGFRTDPYGKLEKLRLLLRKCEKRNEYTAKFS